MKNLCLKNKNLKRKWEGNNEKRSENMSIS